MIELDSRFSTTRFVHKKKPICRERNLFFTPRLFLDANAHRNGEGGLRFDGYYKKNYGEKPLITVIIAVFNGDAHIEETILSVLDQSYDNVELIIIDGGSTDKTLNIIKKYEKAIDYWVSESDTGISDAFNKGVLLSSGDYINFQGDGDGFYSVSSLDRIMENVDPDKDMFVCGRIQRIDDKGDELYLSRFTNKFNKRSLLFRMSLPHQALFTNYKYFQQYGLFDVDNTFCMDYEHILRSYKDFPNAVTKNEIVAKWRADGLGNNRELEIFKEYNNIKISNDVASRTTLFFINHWILFKFYTKKLLTNIHWL